MERLKSKIKNFLGPRIIQNIKGTFRLLHNFAFFKKRMIVLSDRVDCVEIISIPSRHCFTGYYDVPLYSEKRRELLIQTMKLSAVPGRDKLDINVYNVDNKSIKKIAETYAWNWQQGCRLRWSLVDENCVFFNMLVGDKYQCQKINVETGKIVHTFNDALYDISKNELIGATCNFNRLQRLRPGYGYSNISDRTVLEKAPHDDGLFVMNLITGEKTLIVNLEDLSQLNDPELKNQHYINHISFSPDNDKIMFFHLFSYANPEIVGWKTQLCIVNVDGTDLKVLESDANVSHYSWIDEDKLLITGITLPNIDFFYRIYDCRNGGFIDITTDMVRRDGHPTMVNKTEFITDTYPDSTCMQHIILYDKELKQGDVILSVFSDPRMEGERRCDLHPKVLTKEIVTFDTTYKNNKRSVVLAKIRNEI